MEINQQFTIAAMNNQNVARTDGILWTIMNFRTTLLALVAAIKWNKSYVLYISHVSCWAAIFEIVKLQNNFLNGESHHKGSMGYRFPPLVHTEVRLGPNE